MNNHKYPTKYILDSFIILLNISNSYSIVPYLLFFQHSRTVNTAIILLINIVYFIVRFNHNKIFSNYSLFLIYIVICSVNILSSLITETIIFQTVLYPVTNSLFFLIMVNCFNEYMKTECFKRSLWLVLRGYIWLCLACLVSVILLFILLKVGVNGETNLVNDRFDLFRSNVELSGHIYYFPYYTSILLIPKIMLRIPFFTDDGVICGIYYEPHILTFMLFPALFFLFGYFEKRSVKALCFIVWVFIMLLASSATNIVAFSFCLFLLLLFKRKGILILLPICALFVWIIVNIGLENTDFSFLVEKLSGGDNSRDYSMGTIEYAFSPKSFIGYNFMSTNYINEITNAEKKDVGYLPFFINIVFLLFFILKQVNLFLKDKFKRYIALGVIYFFIHSMKVAMVSYTLSFLMLMIFVLYAVEKSSSCQFANK